MVAPRRRARRGGRRDEWRGSAWLRSRRSGWPVPAGGRHLPHRRHRPPCADGFLTLVGRRDAMINVGGLRSRPIEVAATLERHPAVREAAVLGFPDGRDEEVVYAVVSLSEAAGEVELVAFCRDNLAEHRCRAASRFETSCRVRRAARCAWESMTSTLEPATVERGSPGSSATSSCWERREIPLDQPLGELGVGLDSLALVNLLTAVEAAFQVELSDDIWTERGPLSVNDLAEIVRSTRPAAARLRRRRSARRCCTAGWSKSRNGFGGEARSAELPGP